MKPRTRRPPSRDSCFRACAPGSSGSTLHQEHASPGHASHPLVLVRTAGAAGPQAACLPDRDGHVARLAVDAGRIEAEFAGIALGDLDAGRLVYEVDIAALVAVHLRSGEIELDQVAQAGRAEDVLVSICGELAGDPRAAPLLVAMGFDQLSMNAGSLSVIKRVLSAFSRKELEQLMAALAPLRSAQEVVAALDRALSERGLDVFLRRGGAV